MLARQRKWIIFINKLSIKFQKIKLITVRLFLHLDSGKFCLIKYHILFPISNSNISVVNLMIDKSPDIRVGLYVILGLNQRRVAHF